MPEYTDIQFEELLKCRKDFKYFASTYLQITHPKLGLIPFKLYPFQERVIEEFETYPSCITKKFRQAGFTTLACMWMLWKCLFFNDQRILIISKTDREARGVGKTVSYAKSKLPAWLIPEMGNDNDHEKEFIDTGSVMWFYTASAGRSKSLTYLIIDEAAFIQGMEEHWAALYPTLATGGNCIIISTVNGIGNWYEQQYSLALEKKNEFHIVEVDWHEHPDYNNSAWEKRTRTNLGSKRFAQEIEGSFLGSGETYIPGELIQEYEKQCIDPIKKALGEWDIIPEEEFDPKKCMLPNKSYEPGAMWIWDQPKPGRDYILSADVAEGIGEEGDYCAFVIIDTASLTQVAEFYSNTIPPYKFSQVITQVARIYNVALVVVENSLGPGQAVCERLQHSLSYENLYFTVTATRDKPGLNMNKIIRPVCMEALQTCMLNRLVRIRSIRLMKELRTFIYNRIKQRAEAQKLRHDDLTVAMAAALYVADAQNRDVPIMHTAKSTEMDAITRCFHNSDYDKLRIELEAGLVNEDLLDDQTDLEIEFLPKIMFEHKRPLDKLLREFGW